MKTNAEIESYEVKFLNGFFLFLFGFCKFFEKCELANGGPACTRNRGMYYRFGSDPPGCFVSNERNGKFLRKEP